MGQFPFRKTNVELIRIQTLKEFTGIDLFILTRGS